MPFADLPRKPNILMIVTRASLHTRTLQRDRVLAEPATLLTGLGDMMIWGRGDRGTW